MDPSKLIRNPEKVHACLKETPDNRLMCTKDVKLYIPARFVERSLAQIGLEIYIVGIYGLVVEDTYFASSMVNAMMQITPTSMMHIDIDGEEYLEFFFEKGSTVIKSTNLVQIKTLVYKIYNEIVAGGRVPWYLDYLRLGRIFDTAKKHAGANLGGNQEVSELIISMISRDAKDRTKYYRASISSLAELGTNPPAYIPLRSVQYAATNTLNKLAGSYFSDAVVSALVNPADRTERIESLLRR